MNLETIEKLLLKKQAATYDFPFKEEYQVFRVGSKMFAIVSLEDEPLRMNLKCEPNNAIALRDIYESVLPGYHMNKKHWNTIILDDSIPLEVLQDIIDESYELVFKGLKKTEKEKVVNS